MKGRGFGDGPVRTRGPESLVEQGFGLEATGGRIDRSQINQPQNSNFSQADSNGNFTSTPSGGQMMIFQPPRRQEEAMTRGPESFDRQNQEQYIPVPPGQVSQKATYGTPTPDFSRPLVEDKKFGIVESRIGQAAPPRQFESRPREGMGYQPRPMAQPAQPPQQRGGMFNQPQQRGGMFNQQQPNQQGMQQMMQFMQQMMQMFSAMGGQNRDGGFGGGFGGQQQYQQPQRQPQQASPFAQSIRQRY